MSLVFESTHPGKPSEYVNLSQVRNCEHRWEERLTV